MCTSTCSCACHNSCAVGVVGVGGMNIHHLSPMTHYSHHPNPTTHHPLLPHGHPTTLATPTSPQPLLLQPPTTPTPPPPPPPPTSPQPPLLHPPTMYSPPPPHNPSTPTTHHVEWWRGRWEWWLRVHVCKLVMAFCRGQWLASQVSF